MAYSYSNEVVDAFTDATTTATADASAQPADNCHTIVVLNTDTTNSVRVGIVANGTALSDANSALLTAGAAITWRIGTAEYRPCGRFTSSTRLVRVVAIAGTPSVSFQYLNAAGQVAP